MTDTGTNPCTHQTLTWASGGFYLVCATCGKKWVATKPNSDEPDHSFALVLQRGTFKWEPSA
ncbi:MAG: hypothetical protein INF64_13150 [Roseomonas sp.]|nr:hypothetical protein [Roseomonas sp.]